MFLVFFFATGASKIMLVSVVVFFWAGVNSTVQHVLSPCIQLQVDSRTFVIFSFFPFLCCVPLCHSVISGPVFHFVTA